MTTFEIKTKWRHDFDAWCEAVGFEAQLNKIMSPYVGLKCDEDERRANDRLAMEKIDHSIASLEHLFGKPVPPYMATIAHTKGHNADGELVVHRLTVTFDEPLSKPNSELNTDVEIVGKP